MAESEIIRSAKIPEIFIAEGCFIRELCKSPDGIVSFADARLSPGQRTENHSLNVDEYYYIRSGTGDMYLNGILTGSVKSGELVKIKKHDAQYIHNTGTEDLIFLCVCLPAFQQNGYNSI
ncbi:MAG: cupin domain-containing protein [Saprospiraceae bacterium]|nr:cupin domain-containing protein [Saprospiraceae bacterium]MBK7810458.1 cupin domain-containing protein [Saprospiraceae bacterium]MBK9630050.1 cupin domain-containing protein [Saprospiraceae bacterium]